MSATGLEVFDNTLQITNAWLNEIGEDEGIGPDAQRSYHALRAVLWTLRDRLVIDEAFDLSAQLPLLIRGIFWDGYRPAGKPEDIRSREEFLEKVAERLEQIGLISPEDSIRAVFRVLSQRITPGQMEEVRQMLPEEIRTMFPAEGA